jgi:hypothetical protein
MDFDYCEITAYESGKITCKEDLAGFHYGASSSSFNDFGVDMRAEVMLLDRNIMIKGNEEGKTLSG